MEEALDRSDSLLLVLSAHSVKRSWLEKDVAIALKYEQHRHQRVLFPLLLDDAIMRAPQPWVAALASSRALADFTRWKEQDAYQHELQQLVQALNSPSRWI